MLLVYGTIGMAITALLFAVVLIMCRNPRESFWTSDFLVGNIYTPAIVALMAVSAAFFVKYFIFLGERPFNMTELMVVLGILAATVVVLKVMGIKKRLAEYEALQKPADIIKPVAFGHAGDQTDEPPHTTTTGRRAA